MKWCCGQFGQACTLRHALRTKRPGFQGFCSSFIHADVRAFPPSSTFTSRPNIVLGTNYYSNISIMPIIRDFVMPKTVATLGFPSAKSVLFMAFLASEDPHTKRPWCPDVVAALPTLEATFAGARKPVAVFVEVGQRPE